MKVKYPNDLECQAPIPGNDYSMLWTFFCLSFLFCDWVGTSHDDAASAIAVDRFHQSQSTRASQALSAYIVILSILLGRLHVFVQSKGSENKSLADPNGVVPDSPDTHIVGQPRQRKMKKQAKRKHATPGIRWSSPTQLLLQLLQA